MAVLTFMCSAVYRRSWSNDPCILSRTGEGVCVCVHTYNTRVYVTEKVSPCHRFLLEVLQKLRSLFAKSLGICHLSSVKRGTF